VGIQQLTLSKTKKLFLEFISFNSPRAIVINLILIFLILSVMPTPSLKYLPIKPVFKEMILPLIFKGDCPTEGVFKDCDVYSTGQTRAMSRLLHGDLKGAYQFNKLIFYPICRNVNRPNDQFN
jgi:hypothetical protein